MKHYYVYILTNPSNTVLYIGITNNIKRRVYEHKRKLLDGFTKKYNCTKLLYFESFPNPTEAISREKQLKNWRREWKWNLIKNENADLKDLALEWFD